MTNSIPEIQDADCIFVIGSNTTEAHPLIAHRVFRAKQKGAKLIVVDPRKIQLTLFADIHVRIKYGTDVVFLNGVMNEILKNNLQNGEFIRKKTEGFENFRKAVLACPAEKASLICGVPADVIREVAKAYATKPWNRLVRPDPIGKYCRKSGAAWGWIIIPMLQRGRSLRK